ncbi:hypothetical protein M0804_009044 [Polistes exclamans]|nr:hypothetical protein M0804_009044 [Polistes exclamans]
MGGLMKQTFLNILASTYVINAECAKNVSGASGSNKNLALDLKSNIAKLTEFDEYTRHEEVPRFCAIKTSKSQKVVTIGYLITVIFMKNETYFQTSRFLQYFEARPE